MTPSSIFRPGRRRSSSWRLAVCRFFWDCSSCLRDRLCSAGSGGRTHAGVGGLVLLPVAALVGYAVLVPRLRGFAWWAGVVLVLYLGQVALAASGPAALAFHPLNAALLLTASLIFLFKVERRSRNVRGSSDDETCDKPLLPHSRGNPPSHRRRCRFRKPRDRSKAHPPRIPDAGC
jgi:hypothetical protein